jgi:hypothetical protein
MKYEKGKKSIYIKIMYREPKVVSYTLGNTVTTIDD